MASNAAEHSIQRFNRVCHRSKRKKNGSNKLTTIELAYYCYVWIECPACESASECVSLMLLLFDVKRLLFISSIAYHDIEIYDPNNSNLQAIHLVIARLIHPGLSISRSPCNKTIATKMQQTNCRFWQILNTFSVLLFCCFVSLSRSLLFFCHPELRHSVFQWIEQIYLSRCVRVCVCMAMTKSVPVTTRQIILINPFINCRYCAKDGTTAPTTLIFYFWLLCADRLSLSFVDFQRKERWRGQKWKDSVLF